MSDARQMALDALNDVVKALGSICPSSSYGNDVSDRCESAIAALESELAQVVAVPVWTDTAEAMLHINTIESMLGGANGPTIRLRALVAAPQPAAPEPVVWYPINGDTRGYTGDVVLRSPRWTFKLCHSNWVGSAECYDGRTGLSGPAYKALLKDGYTEWLPLGATP